MSSGFDQLERELIGAARRRRSRRFEAADRARANGGLFVLASIAVVVIITAGAVTLLRHRANQPPASSPQRSPLTLSCGFHFHSARVTNAQPSRRLLDRLAILRRPETVRDQAIQATIRRCGVTEGPTTPTAINIDYARYVGRAASGGRLYLVPITGMNIPGLGIGRSLPKNSTLGRQSLEPAACLITARAHTLENSGCTPLELIIRPFAGLLASRIFLSKSDRVVTGVVRDGIQTLDVERDGIRYLTGIPVPQNVIDFEVAPEVPSGFAFIFRNTRGLVLPPRHP